jgi:hypothetical protein
MIIAASRFCRDAAILPSIYHLVKRIEKLGGKKPFILRGVKVHHPQTTFAPFFLKIPLSS